MPHDFWDRVAREVAAMLVQQQQAPRPQPVPSYQIMPCEAAGGDPTPPWQTWAAQADRFEGSFGQDTSRRDILDGPQVRR